jgi:hypothetical protein
VGPARKILPEVLSFTCRDCQQRFTRLVQGDPTLVSRCFGCDGDEVRRASERLLRLVFGAPAV